MRSPLDEILSEAAIFIVKLRIWVSNMQGGLRISPSTTSLVIMLIDLVLCSPNVTDRMTGSTDTDPNEQPHTASLDLKLISLLSLFVCPDADANMRKVLVMDAFRQSIAAGQIQQHDAPQSITIYCSAVVAWAFHYSAHTLLWMQSFQSKKQRKKHAWKLHLTSQEQQAQQVLVASA